MGEAMKEVGAFEAKSRLGRLLDWVEAGEEVTITRRGKAVARLVPATLPLDAEKGLKIAARIREMRQGVTLGELKIRDLISEGRR